LVKIDGVQECQELVKKPVSIDGVTVTQTGNTIKIKGK